MTKIKPEKAVAYVRVSGVKQQREGDGLNSQLRVCENYIQYNRMEMVEVFTDVETGGIKTRPGMDALLAFLRAQSEPHAVIIDSISRLSREARNHDDLRNDIIAAGGILMCPTMEFKDDLKDRMPERMMALIVEHERLNNAHRSKSRMVARMQNGYWTLPCPVGYRYEEEKGRGKVLVRNEPQATILASALEDFAHGVYTSQAEVIRALNNNPDYLTGKTSRVLKGKFKRMLENPIYAGYIHYPKWGVSMVEAQHEPLISLATHQKIKDRLKKRPKFPVRLTENPEFAIRGLVCCKDCSRPYWGSFSKGNTTRIAYYRCGTKGCASYGKSIQRDKVECDFGELLGQLAPKEGISHVAAHMFKELWDRNVKAIEARTRAAKENLKAIDVKIGKLIERAMEATRSVMIKAYEDKITALDVEKKVKEEQLKQLTSHSYSNLPEFDEALKNTLNFLLNPMTYWLSGNHQAKRLAAKLTFGSDLLYCRENGFSNPKPSAPFQIIQSLSSNRKENAMHEYLMVPRRGLEPPRPYGH